MTSFTRTQEAILKAKLINSKFATTGKIVLPDGTYTTPKRLPLGKYDDRKRTEAAPELAGPSVCELCTCGLHNCGCTHTRKPTPFNGNSTYLSDFDRKNAKPATSFKPANSEFVKPLKFDAATTNQTDFVEWDIPRMVATDSEKMIRPNLPFEGKSTYNADFFKKSVGNTIMKPKQVYRPNTGKFYGNTVYGTDFDIKDVSQVKSCKPKQRKTSQLPFIAKSCYASEYTEKDIPESQNRHISTRDETPETRSFSTTNSDAYKGEQLPAKKRCPLDVLPKYTAPHPTDKKRHHIFWDPVAELWY